MNALPLLLLSLSWAAPAAAPAPAPVPPITKPSKPLPGEPVELKAVDGWTLQGVWQKAQEGKMTLVLLHGTGQRKEDWRQFAAAAAKQGYGYFALDLRGHGESRMTPSGEVIVWKKLKATKAENDFADMTRDVEAAVAWLGAQGVAQDQIGLVGAEVGSSVAVKHAAVSPRASLVVMLSPGMAWQEIPLVNAVRAFKGRSIFILMVHSEKDKRSSKETPILYRFAQIAVGDRDVTLKVVPEERGTRMIRANKGLADEILGWIANPLKPEVAVSTSSVSVDTAAPAGEEPPEPPTDLSR